LRFPLALKKGCAKQINSGNVSVGGYQPTDF